LLGNGFCNKETNIAECKFDFGECCPASVLNDNVEKAENCDDTNCECNPDSSVNFPGDCLVGTDGTCQKGMLDFKLETYPKYGNRSLIQGVPNGMI
jgi:hypothetical protein